MPSDALLERLLAIGPVRVGLREVKAAYRAAAPEFAELGDFDARLLNSLRALRQDGRLELPKGISGWDKTVVPSMPMWVAVRRPTTKPCRSAVPWVPELAFATGCPPETRRTLEVLNDWILENRSRGRPVVPTAERSLEIFGDEKRLAGMFKGSPRIDGEPTMFSGRLRLSVLRAREVEPPLHHVRGRVGLPILVVENLASYDTLVRWHTGTPGVFGAIAWGAGGNFEKSWTHLGEVVAAAKTGTVLYLGDLDAPGLTILGRAAARAEAGHSFRIRPHECLYRFLCLHGRKVRRTPDPATLAAARVVLANLFPPDIAASAEVLLAAAQAVPQESIGIEALGELAHLLASHSSKTSPTEDLGPAAPTGDLDSRDLVHVDAEPHHCEVKENCTFGSP